MGVSCEPHFLVKSIFVLFLRYFRFFSLFTPFFRCPFDLAAWGRGGPFFPELAASPDLARPRPRHESRLAADAVHCLGNRMPTRNDAWKLLCEYTQSESLRKHMLAVEACVRAYARKSGADENTWGLAALLHDFDYERWPNHEHSPDQGHPSEGAKILRQQGYPDEIVRAILSHADYCNVPRQSALEHTLFACDEIAGFLTACAYVRPSKSTNTSTPSASAAVYEAVPADGVCLFQTVPHLKRAFRARSTGRLGWTFWRETPETGRRRKRLSGAVVQEPSRTGRFTPKPKSRYNCRECLRKLQAMINRLPGVRAARPTA